MLLLLVACAPTPTDTASKPGDTGDSGDTADTAPTADTLCSDLGLTVRDWQEGEATTALNGLATDFTLTTTDGEWNFRENWNGCESYLFIQDEPEQATGWPKELWQRDVNDLLVALPKNVEVFFLTTYAGKNGEESLAAMQDEVSDAYAKVDADVAAWWPDHLHFVTTPVRQIDSWLGEVLVDPGWGVGIDRFQTIRYIGSYGDPERYNDDYQWFEPNISMAANESIYYNFESDRDDLMQAEGATVVPVLSGTVSGNLTGTAELPDATGFDTLTVDTAMRCGGVGEYGYCPAWDYMAYLFLTVDAYEPDNPYASTPCQAAADAVQGTCTSDGSACSDDSTCGEGTCEGEAGAVSAETATISCFAEGGQLPDGYVTCNAAGTGFESPVCPTEIEIGRWITTYHREGRWVYDISAMLPFFRSGGPRTLRFETSGPYTLDVSFRYSNQGKAESPKTTRYLLDAGKNKIPVSVDIPATAKKVELATVISQHGSDAENCGEFCNIEHRFIINGNETSAISRDFPEAEGTYDCMEKAAQGTVPNQYGTWWYGRAGWCPGLEVPTVMADITDQVTIGGTNTIEYQHWRNGAEYTGGATLRLQSWIVVSE